MTSRDPYMGHTLKLHFHTFPMKKDIRDGFEKKNNTNETISCKIWDPDMITPVGIIFN